MYCNPESSGSGQAAVNSMCCLSHCQLGNPALLFWILYLCVRTRRRDFFNKVLCELFKPGKCRQSRRRQLFPSETSKALVNLERFNSL